MWAFWGSIENFHEGWYYREWWRNVGLAVVQYLPWMFVPMTAAALALWRTWAGVAAHVMLAIGAFQLFGFDLDAGPLLIAMPMLVLAVLYGYGRPRPIVRARRVLVGIPIATALVSGAYPGWRAVTRPVDVDLTMTRLTANGVDLIWAPAGPGWPDRGFDWEEARRRCDYLTADGRALADTAQHIWRLPTVDEAVRSQIYRRENAGGSWDAATRRPRYRVQPDKDAPLWNRYSPVIYWWTADELDADRAYRVVYNGFVNAMPKRIGPDYLACRCVKAPQ